MESASRVEPKHLHSLTPLFSLFAVAITDRKRERELCPQMAADIFSPGGGNGNRIPRPQGGGYFDVDYHYRSANPVLLRADYIAI